MTNVYLYGHLGRKFGWRWSLDVASPAEAIRAIAANRPDFQRYLVSHSTPGYHVVIGDESVDEKGLHHPVGRQAIKLVLVVAGAEKPGWVNIVIGVVIIMVAIAAGPWGWGFIGPGAALMVGAIGASLAISGISTVLSGNPDSLDANEKEANKPSFLFQGPVNTIAQGHPVPVGYGRLRIGSAVISASISTVDIAV